MARISSTSQLIAQFYQTSAELPIPRHMRSPSGRHGRSMYGMGCGVDAFDSSRPGPWPITLPRDSREDSEHKKQHRDGSLRVVRIAGGFPTDYLRTATNVMVIKIRKDLARCDFEDIPPGTYAMAVVHDDSMNGKLVTNDAKGVLGAPPFSAASFPYNGQNLELTMSCNTERPCSSFAVPNLSFPSGLPAGAADLKR